MALSSDQEAAIYIAWTKSMIAKYLYHASLIVTPIGLVLNFIQILVFSRKKFKTTTMGFYNIVSKTITLHVGFLYLAELVFMFDTLIDPFDL